MKKASELIEQIFDSLHIEDEQDVVSLFREWEQIVGSDIGSHSTIVELEGNTLIVSADHPGWVQMLQMHKRSIIKKIQRLYPELQIKYLRIVLG
ncbi:MAG: DUF721 domain-containing protein [Spirochaetota bacterium]